jgi:ketosteroid isomerase-like protein
VKRMEIFPGKLLGRNCFRARQLLAMYSSSISFESTQSRMTSPADPSTLKTLARELVDTFASGWSKGQLDRIISVFNTDAVFQETPFAERLEGTEAIRRYWSDVPYHQSEITVTTGEIYVAGPWFATEFKSVFRRRRTGEWVEAKGALFCETSDGRIAEMRMYWHRKP